MQFELSSSTGGIRMGNGFIMFIAASPLAVLSMIVALKSARR